MNEVKFWDLIESCAESLHDGNAIVRHFNKISAAFGHLSESELKEFLSIFYLLREQLRSSQLAQAAFILAHGMMVDDSVNVILTGVIMHGREFYRGCLESPESTLLSMADPHELQNYGSINIDFDQLHQNMGWNYGIPVASCADDLAMMKRGVQDQKGVEEILRHEMPRLFKRCW